MNNDDHNQEYSMLEPFFIDESELDGVSPENAFVLGVEWQMVFDQMQTGEAFERPVHGLNRSRIMRLLVRNGRMYHISKAKDGWCNLCVLEADDA